MDRAELNSRASSIISLFKERFLNPEGLLARNYPVTQRTIFDNFDDLVPFFLYFQEKEFLLEQIKRLRALEKDIRSLCANDGVLISRNLDEWVGGLYAVWKESEDIETFSLLSESLDFILKNLVREDLLSAAYLIKERKAVSYYEPWSCGLLETFCEMRDTFPDLFLKAKAILDNWLKDEYFKAFGLFPYRRHSSLLKSFVHKNILAYLPNSRQYSMTPPCKNNGRLEGLIHLLRLSKFELTVNGWYSQLMKSNSTCAFSMLEFYLATKEPFWKENLERWLNSTFNNFYCQGKVYGEFNPVSGVKRDAGVSSAFILADIICDSAYFIPEFRRFLDIAKNILDYQWQNRLANGLLPYTDKGDFAHIDSQVDFSVTLRRYSELSQDTAYRDRAVSLVERALHLHYSKDGYLTYSGKIDKNVIDPKYNALLLKGLINVLTIEEPLYPKYYSLFKDR